MLKAHSSAKDRIDVQSSKLMSHIYSWMSVMEYNNKALGEPTIKPEIPKAKLNADEHLFCDNCKTSIVDYHRKCPYCSYDLCLSCCRGLREGCQPGGGKAELAQQQSTDRGYSREGLPRNKQTKVSGGRSGWELHSQVTSNSTVDPTDRLPDWKANSDGSIPCRIWWLWLSFIRIKTHL